MGIIRCDGCNDRFCSTHFTDHRHHLETLFERVCNDRDSLCERINNPCTSSSANHPQLILLLNQISEWESETLKMVQQTADCARQQVNELMNSNNKAVELELDKLSKELRRRKEDDDYFEQDIERLNKQLKQIQLDLNSQSPYMRINATSINWSTVIQVLTERPKRNTVNHQQNQLFVGGTLLTIDHQIQLNQFYGNESQKWQLVYKATRDGFDSDIFHQCCDNQGPTLTVVRSSEGYLFGGYTALNWDVKGGWTVDKTAFLFTLTNPHNILPTQYTINLEGKNAILLGLGIGPVFGRWDICIYLGDRWEDESFSNFPSNYIDSTRRGYLTFTGSKNFLTNDIEIYRLIND